MTAYDTCDRPVWHMHVRVLMRCNNAQHMAGTIKAQWLSAVQAPGENAQVA
jgi:hypothetical protein